MDMIELLLRDIAVLVLKAQISLKYGKNHLAKDLLDEAETKLMQCGNLDPKESERN